MIGRDTYGGYALLVGVLFVVFTLPISKYQSRCFKGSVNNIDGS